MERRLPPLAALEQPHHHHHIHHAHGPPRPSSTPQHAHPPHLHHHHHHHHPHSKKEKEVDSQSSSSRKRNRQIEEASLHVPSNDRNSWYYSAFPRTTSLEEDEDELPVGVSGGNWGHKDVKGARWVRRGKKAAWGPGRDSWEAEERARKRIRRMLPSYGSPPPPTLPHARSPTPPLVAPYTPPVTQHPNFTSFVLDPSIQHSFRSGLIADLERTAGELIEGEAGLRRALGRLWRVLADDTVAHKPIDPKPQVNGKDLQEEEEEEEEDSHTMPRLGLAANLQRIFITPGDIPLPSLYDSMTGLNPQQQWESLERSLAAMRDLQDDGRECVERLEEIREDLGAVRGARKAAWAIVRLRALEEMDQEDTLFT